jgi:hypothetical protein
LTFNAKVQARQSPKFKDFVYGSDASLNAIFLALYC